MRAKNYAARKVTPVDVPTHVSPLVWAMVESALLHACACTAQLDAQAATIARLQRAAAKHRADALRLPPQEWEERKDGHPSLEKKL